MKLNSLVKIDFLVLLPAIILSVFGVLFVYSSGITSTGELVSKEYIKQSIWLGTGIVICITLALVNYRRFASFSGYLYLGILIVLIYTRLFGKLVNGAKSWIGIGIFGIQPSEIAKIITILFLAYYLDISRRNTPQFKRFVISGIIVILPMLLILSQPDLGTALVFVPIFIVMTFIGGISLRYLAFISGFIVLTGFLTVLPLWQKHILHGSFEYLKIFTNSKSILLLCLSLLIIICLGVFGYKKYHKRYFFWISYVATLFFLALLFSFAGRSILKEYQIMRLIVFLDPNVDPRGSGWNIIQSITAIGSGGFWGKGYLQGTQSHYRFLPQQSTDFIFSIFSEEWGFIGGILVFSLYAIIIFRILRTIKETADPFGAYLCSGVISIIFSHFIVNVGMTMGIMPITGIPLIFMSYGGSSLIAAMTGIGLCLSVHARRFES